MLLQKSQRAPPHSQVWSFPHIRLRSAASRARCHHPSQHKAFLSRHPPHPSGDRPEDLLHPGHRSSPKAKDEATTDLLWSQIWFLHGYFRSAFGWSFLRTFSAAKVSPTFLVLHHLCATHPAFPSTPCMPLSLLFHDCFGSEPWLLLRPEVSLLGNRTQKYESSKEIIK